MELLKVVVLVLLKVTLFPCLQSSPLKRTKTSSTNAMRAEKRQFSHPGLSIEEEGVNDLMPELLHQFDSNTDHGRRSRVIPITDAHLTELPSEKLASLPQQTERVKNPKKSEIQNQGGNNGFGSSRFRVRRQTASAPHCVKRRYFDPTSFMVMFECVKKSSCAPVTCSYQTTSGSLAIAVIDCVDATNSTSVTKPCT